MKLFRFEYDSYGISYNVIEESPEKALEAVKAELKKRAIKKGRYGKRYDGSKYQTYEWDNYEEWKEATLSKLPDDYSLEIYEVGEVLETEVS